MADEDGKPDLQLKIVQPDEYYRRRGRRDERRERLLIIAAAILALSFLGWLIWSVATYVPG